MSGLNLHQVESILLESYQRTRDFDPHIMKELKSEMVKRSKILEVRDPKYSFEDIGGYHAIKDFILKYMINVLRRPEKARYFGLGLPKGFCSSARLERGRAFLPMPLPAKCNCRL